MADVRQLLNDALTRLDASAHLERHQVTAALEPVGKVAKATGEKVDELRFEFVATYLTLNDQPDVWGTFFGPESTKTTEDGQRFDNPPLESITPECINYWIARMKAAQHPAMRARYADLVWDLSYKAAGNKPPIEAAHIAIDGYVEAITTGRCDPFDGSGDVLRRAITLAASVDPDRLRNVIPTLQQHAAAPSEPEERDRRAAWNCLEF